MIDENIQIWRGSLSIHLDYIISLNLLGEYPKKTIYNNNNNSIDAIYWVILPNWSPIFFNNSTQRRNHFPHSSLKYFWIRYDTPRIRRTNSIVSLWLPTSIWSSAVCILNPYLSWISSIRSIFLDYFTYMQLGFLFFFFYYSWK